MIVDEKRQLVLNSIHFAHRLDDNLVHLHMRRRPERIQNRTDNIVRLQHGRILKLVTLRDHLRPHDARADALRKTKPKHNSQYQFSGVHSHPTTTKKCPEIATYRNLHPRTFVAQVIAQRFRNRGNGILGCTVDV